MALALLLLVLLNYCSGVASQATLTQPASQSVSLGQTVKISCLQSGGLDSSYTFAWYQQRPAQAPRFVFADTSTRGEGIPDRFTGSQSGNTGYLTISDTLAEDEANYYCATNELSGGYKYIFGGGTQLNILGQPTVAPRVNAYPPSPEELGSSDNATLVCLLDGFYPGTVHVSWEGDDTPISSGVETTTPTKLNDKYMASSYLNMRKSDWESYETVTCKVTHEGKTIEKVVRR